MTNFCCVSLIKPFASPDIETQKERGLMNIDRIKTEAIRTKVQIVKFKTYDWSFTWQSGYIYIYIYIFRHSYFDAKDESNFFFSEKFISRLPCETLIVSLKFYYLDFLFLLLLF